MQWLKVHKNILIAWLNNNDTPCCSKYSSLHTVVYTQSIMHCVLTRSNAGTDSGMKSYGSNKLIVLRTFFTRAAPRETNTRGTALSLGDVWVDRTFTAVINHRNPTTAPTHIYTGTHDNVMHGIPPAAAAAFISPPIVYSCFSHSTFTVILVSLDIWLYHTIS